MPDIGKARGILWLRKNVLSTLQGAEGYAMTIGLHASITSFY